eukprot:CAMPEP_0197925666 /NCGR_PEP_ID=MMETSP1439-20131203/97845_1 /TAXON_ID=66791 /ORGANISM="Gonyaulax spinifera, Strain CCMP409" /LENGTH=73 /DNA_ID=CAMNT_0043548153 /DNA_START=36 /DNA_END=254 /DNA_ORIENTATION=+
MAPMRLATAVALGLFSAARGLTLGAGTVGLEHAGISNETVAADVAEAESEAPGNETFPISKDGKVEVTLFYET